MVTDGLLNINIKKDDTIVISGMGTDTIIKILNMDLKNDLIISSNNHLEKLRRFIISKGYHIEKEVFVLENNKPYVIIKFKYGKKEYSRYEYIIGTIENDDTYFNYLLEKYQEILNKIPDKYSDKKTYYTDLIEYIKRKKVI